MSEKTVQTGTSPQEEPSLSTVSLSSIRGLREVVEAEPHALPPRTNNLVEEFHFGALRGLAQQATSGVPEERRRALSCPSANLRLVA